MKRRSNVCVPRFHPNCALPGGETRPSQCCNGHARQRFASALCGGRSPAHGRLLAAPLRGSPLCGMERGTSVCPHQRFKQDETTLIVARPTQKIKGHRCEISASAVIPRRELRHREPGGRNAKAHGDAVGDERRQKARHKGHCEHQTHVHHHHGKRKAPRFPVHRSGALCLFGVVSQKKEKEKGEQIYSHVVPTGLQWNAVELTPRPAARQSPLRRCGS